MFIFESSARNWVAVMMESAMSTMSLSSATLRMALTSDQLSPPTIVIANLSWANFMFYSPPLKTEQTISPKTSLSMVWDWRGSDRILQNRGTTSSMMDVYRFKCIPVVSIRFSAIFCWSFVIVLVLLLMEPS